MKIRKVASKAALFTHSAIRRATSSAKQVEAVRTRLKKTDSSFLQLSRLEVVENDEPANLQITMSTVNSFVPQGLWVERDGEDLHRVGDVLPVAGNFPKSEKSQTFHFALDTDALVQSIDSWTSSASAQESPDEGITLRLFVEYRGLSDEELESVHAATTYNGEKVGLVRLGRANSTHMSDFEYRDHGNHFSYPHITRFGYLSLEVDRLHVPYAQLRNDSLKVKNGKLRIRGRLNARGTRYLNAELVVLGRVSGFKATTPVSLELNKDVAARRFGLKQYRFVATMDFNRLVDSIEDDNADIYLDLKPQLGEETKRARLGKSRYLVRNSTYGGSVNSRGKTVSITPYYTFKAKNPSLYLETFETPTYEFLQTQLSQPPSRRKNGHPSRPTWLIGELPYKAQDNGLEFFKYMRDHHPEIDAYYVIDDGSPERVNVEGYDNVLSFRSTEHIRVALAADKIIGTHHPDFLYPTREPRFHKALHADQVFLQHGVTAAKWMVPNYGKSAEGFEVDLITVCSEREKEFFVKDFGYSEHEVAVTGFARFDTLLRGDVEVRHEQLMIMPTWRPWLQDPEYFAESEYFARWRSLLTSPRFRRIIAEYSLDPVFCLHPNMRQFSSHFLDAGVRVVVQGEVDVQFLLKQSSMLVTDYSSVAFDFAFLHKPVAYYQFDDYRFAPPHADPVREFPGPVVAEERLILDAIEDAYSAGAAMDPYYKERADKFLAHRDTQSRERIFQAVSRAVKPRRALSDAFHHETVQSAYKIARKQRAYLPAMKQAYKLMRLAPLNKNTIVFESGQGQQFGDSPRAIYEELIHRGDERKKIWIYNKRIPLQDKHTTVVKRHSPLFFWYLATAKYWVNNHNFPSYIHRRKGGVYLQTWHGTPLKRMFLDQDNFHGRDPGYVGRVKEASAQWNALVSPSPYATAAMQSSYGYTGPVHELGYPRNDVLRGPDAERLRTIVRHRLSIPKNKTVILYAPTFRDDQPTKRGRFSFDWPFNPASFVDYFGVDVILVVRTHVLVNTKLKIPEELRSNIIDASDYPDIQELFLASDMLITDYSSSFFDYSVLERPIIFYAYDLENYRDNLRGFYLNYDTDLPGPIVETSQDLFKEIAAARDFPVTAQQQMREFALRYAPNDDGHASGRVIDLLLDD